MSVAPAADLHLELAADSSERRPTVSLSGHAEELGVGELLARPGVAVVEEDVEARGAQLLVETLGGLALVVPGLPSPTSSTSHGAIERGQEMPCSSAYCSTAAAAIRAGPMP